MNFASGTIGILSQEGELAGYEGKCFLGLDVGSTTTKAALIDDKGAILHSYYGSNEGNPSSLCAKRCLGCTTCCPRALKSPIQWSPAMAKA
jgi:activator of 2-hydroxyglutaryl-CoA dehydratase